jgi:multiple sugar transport system permease protein
MTTDNPRSGPVPTARQSAVPSQGLFAWWSTHRRKVLSTAGLVFLQILMTVVLITFLVPALWMISSSLKVSTEVFAHPIVWIPKDPHWQNYARLFQLPGLSFARFAQNTVVVVFFAVIGTVVSSAMVAYSFARLQWPGRDFFFAMLMATMMLPEVITLIPRFIIYRHLGWIDTLLPLTVPYWCATTAFYVFLLRQFFRGLPVELEEAAVIDGAGRLRIFAQIMLPLSTPVLATVAVFALLQHYTDYMNPLIYLNSMEKWTLAVGIGSLNANESFGASWELVFTAGTVMTLPILVLYIFAQRYFVKGIAMTGLKG